MAEVRARGVEANKRKREEKAAQKEEKKEKVKQNLSKTPSHVAGLLEELNILADEELKKTPEVDKEGNPVNFYFFTEHHEKDLDCFGVLANLRRNDVRKGIKFSEDDLAFASNLRFLCTRKECTDIAGKKTLTEPAGWLVESTKLSALMAKEPVLSVQHPKKLHRTVDYQHIVLIRDREPKFIPNADQKHGDKVKKTWYNLGMYFCLPKQGKIILVGVHNCFSCFSKPQQANIVSWFVHYLSKHAELDKVYIPLCLKQAGQLVGAPLGSMKHEELEQIHLSSAEYATGFIYDEPKYQTPCLDVNAAMLQASAAANSRAVFFPECSNKNFLAYDCLPKTTNFLVEFPLFTLREQCIRLIMDGRRRNFDAAAEIKKKGGIPIECMRDFAVDDHKVYSFTKLTTFNYYQTAKAPEKVAQEALDFIEDQILEQHNHDKILVILKGKRLVEFQHALCFIRKDFVTSKRSYKQMLMLDCKNTAPCYYPRLYPDQLQFSPEMRVSAKKDLEDGVYFAADIYALTTRDVVGKEQRRLKNRMKWILTGGEEHLKDSEAIG